MITLGDIRQLLADYQNTRYTLGKWYYGISKEELSLITFLAMYEDWRDGYALFDQELIAFLNLLPPHSTHPLIFSIKAHFHQHRYFFELYESFSSANLLSAEIMEVIYPIENEIERSFLYRLFCQSEDKSIALNAERWELAKNILTIYAPSEYAPYCENMYELFLCLAEKKILTNKVIVLMSQLRASNNDDFLFFISIVKKLNEQDYLTEEMLLTIPAEAELREIMRCVLQIMASYVPLDKELWQAILTSQHLKAFFSLYSHLDKSSSNVFLFEKETLLYFLTQNIAAWKISAILIVQKLNLFEQVSVKKILEESLDENVIAMLSLLFQDKIPQDYSVIVLSLFHHQLSDASVKSMMHLLKLTQPEISLADQGLMEALGFALSEPISPFFEIIDYLQANHLRLSGADLHRLIAQSSNNLTRLKSMVIALLAHNLLDNASFSLALSKVSVKLPSIEISTVEKFSRHKSKQAMSEYFLSSGIHFFAEHQHDKKAYDSGNFALLKKGFKGLDEEKPAFAIKKFRRISKIDNQWAMAKHEAEYHQFFGRDAAYFSRPKYPTLSTMIVDFVAGQSLNHYLPRDFLKYSLSVRLKWVLSGLLDLEGLHKIARVHGDVKSENFILNVNEKDHALTLIDFATARKQGSHKMYQPSTGARDGCAVLASVYSFPDDVYSYGYVIASLFPELYDSEALNFGNLSSIKPEETLLPLEFSIIFLINSLTKQEKMQRATALEACEYCSSILKDESLSNYSLQELRAKTIDNRQLDAESVLRGKRFF
jgi:hypothetical protein